MPGTTLGPYEVVSSLGAGGMGEVYRARDTKLDRDVALKILPESFASDPDRLMRFEREAKTLATLNHPNIAHIHGLEESEGTRALVMELVEGRDLSEVIAQGAMPLDDVVPIAIQLAEALEAAHEAGIIHRDLKPANIKVKADGTVKVLDFGLAKALDPVEDGAGASGPADSTMTSPALTQMGVVLGTAAYMSPEQAKGRPVDRRADIWAFGVVLYEMLTGRQLFAAETVSESIAAVLRADVGFAALPRATPSAVRRLLERCLDRDPRTRLRDIGEARVVLAAPLDAEPVVQQEQAMRPSWWWAAPALAALGLAALAGAQWTARTAPAEADVLALPEDDITYAAISPNGRQVAFRRQGGLFVRALGEDEATRIADVEANVAWSPDGAYIGYTADGQIWKYSLQSGAAVALAPRTFVGPSLGWSWGDDGWMVTSGGNPTEGGIFRWDMVGDRAPGWLILFVPGESQLITPSYLPGGRGPICGVRDGATGEILGRIVLCDGRSESVIFDQPGAPIDSPVYASTGHLLYRQRGANAGVWAVPFALDSLTVTGAPARISRHAGIPSVSADGDLLVIAPASDPYMDQSTAPWRISRTGVRAQLATGTPRGRYIALSPDGRRLATTTTSGLVVWDLERDSLLQISPTDSQVVAQRPFWSPQGDRVGYTVRIGDTLSLEVADATGGGRVAERIENARSGQFTASGQEVVFVREGAVWQTRLDLGPGDEPRQVLQAPGAITGFDLTQSGQHIAYEMASARNERVVFVERFPGGGGRVPVGEAGDPQWGDGGRELFVIRRAGEAQSIEAVTFDPAQGLLGTPIVLADSLGQLTVSRGYDVTADGDIVVLLPPELTTDQRRTLVIRNWTKLLEQRR